MTEYGVEFLHIVYEVGAASCPADALTHHAGREYGAVIRGCLGVTVGFDTYELQPGDGVTFSSSMPHRLFNAARDVVEGIWFVIGRDQ
jgi:uncharacterized cupin superfamily protein